MTATWTSDLDRLARVGLWRRCRVPALHRAAVESGVGGGDGWQVAADEVAAAVLGQSDRWLVVLHGPRGTGKTLIAALALYRRAIRPGAEVVQVGGDTFAGRYVTAFELFLAFRDAMHAGRERAEVAAWAGYPALIIDDAHERGETDYEDRVLTHLIDRRYAERRPTVLITNQHRKAFGESIGPSVTSRVHEAGTVIACDWPSFREREEA